MTTTETIAFDLAFVLLVAVIVVGVGVVAPIVWGVLLIASLSRRISPRLSLPRAIARSRPRIPGQHLPR